VSIWCPPLSHDRQLLRHEGGHCVPQQARHCADIVDFVAAAAAPPSPRAAAPVAAPPSLRAVAPAAAAAAGEAAEAAAVEAAGAAAAGAAGATEQQLEEMEALEVGRQAAGATAIARQARQGRQRRCAPAGAAASAEPGAIDRCQRLPESRTLLLPTPTPTPIPPGHLHVGVHPCDKPPAVLFDRPAPAPGRRRRRGGQRLQPRRRSRAAACPFPREVHAHAGGLTPPGGPPPLCAAAARVFLVSPASVASPLPPLAHTPPPCRPTPARQDYPAAADPAMDVIGPLGSNDPRRAELLRHLAAEGVAQRAAMGGAGYIFSLLDAAREWIDANIPADVGARRREGEGRGAAAAPHAAAAAEDGQVGGDADGRVPWWEAEEADGDLIRAATEEALMAHWAAWDSGSGGGGEDDALDGGGVSEAAAPPAWDAAVAAGQRGAWAYTIGLVRGGSACGRSAPACVCAPAACLAAGRPTHPRAPVLPLPPTRPTYPAQVGKPSAGKSSLFNALTGACWGRGGGGGGKKRGPADQVPALSLQGTPWPLHATPLQKFGPAPCCCAPDPEDARDEAKVGAYPFTTIDPNVGRGCALVPDPAPLLGLAPGVAEAAAAAACLHVTARPFCRQALGCRLPIPSLTALAPRPPTRTLPSARRRRAAAVWVRPGLQPRGRAPRPCQGGAAGAAGRGVRGRQRRVAASARDHQGRGRTGPRSVGRAAGGARQQRQGGGAAAVASLLPPPLPSRACSSRCARAHRVPAAPPLPARAGAYKGRGRGNAFLSDLCDADCLIHVVDASGTTDASGAAAKAGDADPRDDVRWGGGLRA
jgi:hypothetical protein